MPDVAKLKKKAADLELKKQFDKALEVYVQILQGYEANGDDEVDVSLYNRVGDMYLKQGSVAEAVDYYEQAVDRYAEGGFHNNAIALCNKILRNSPGRASVYYKLGKISAQKGFKGEAKKNFLEYADRMQAAGKIDEAFRALKEFADLCPDQDDIRLMLADQLSKQGRAEEALQQLQQLYERYMHEGRTTEAQAAFERMKSLDPDYVPRDVADAPRVNAGSLVFLDLGDGRASAPPPRRPSAQFVKRVTQGLDIILPPEEDPAPHSLATPIVSLAPVPSIDVMDTPVLDAPVLDAITRMAEFETNEAGDGASLLEGLEPTSFGNETAATAPAPELLEFEPTSLAREDAAGTPAPPASADAPELLDFDLPSDDSASAMPPVEIDHELRAPRSHRPSLMGLPMLTDDEGQEPAPADDDESSIGGDLELIMPEGGTPVRGLDPVDDLPLMDLELPMPGEATASISGTLGRNSLEFISPAASDDLGALTFDELPAAPRPSTADARHSVEMLQALADTSPDDSAIRRRLAEALLEKGDREAGLRELENAMVGYEKEDDLASAAEVADEIVLLNPSSVKHHQKRVEYAFRTNERGRLIEAYLQLADALFRAAQVEKSRAIYQRVLDLAPDDLRAHAALDSFPPDSAAEVPAPKPRPTVPQQRVSAQTPRIATPTVPSPVPDDEFVNLGDWLRDDEAPKDTRMIVDEQEPTGDEAADFADMLKKFKQGISENVEDEDHQSHYDLGVAYKEMGLLDEAIAEFQKALRAPANRVPTYEALGLCFIEKEQYPMAATILTRALNEPGMKDEKLVGVLYLLGRCAEERGQRAAAIDFYQRVFVVDIQFRDIGERLAAVEGAPT